MTTAPMKREPLTEAAARHAGETIQPLTTMLRSVLFGQETLIESVIIGILARGHILLEGLPGLGKTELAKGVGRALELQVKRIQFTPDLLPGDITGNPMLRDGPTGRSFEFQPGPLFANLVLADEINRASPKTQAALLEAMQERRVTVMGTAHALPDPFFVLATQNPIELEGTYPLPEAQLDRFLFKLEVAPGGVEVLTKIVQNREIGVEPVVQQVLDRAGLLNLMGAVQRVYLADVVANFIARLVAATHPGGSKSATGVRFGASPRAALALAAGSRARALVHGRPTASFEDVAALAPLVFGHRVLLDYSARMDGKTSRSIVGDILQEIKPVDMHLPPTMELRS